MSGIANACSALLCCDFSSTSTAVHSHARDPLYQYKSPCCRRLFRLTVWMPMAGVSGRVNGPSMGQTDKPHLPFLLGSPPLTPHCLHTQSIGPGLLDRSIALYRAVAVCHVQSPASQQLQAHARVCQLAPFLFSPHRLPPHGSLARLACLEPVCPSARLPLSGVLAHLSYLLILSLCLDYRPTPMLCGTNIHSTTRLVQARLFLVYSRPYQPRSHP